MKIICILLLTFGLAHHVHATGTVSIEVFRNTKDFKERQQIIDQAPKTQQVELRRIHVHLLLIQDYGSEERLKRLKENAVAKSRGFDGLTAIFHVYMNLWECHISGEELSANRKIGKSSQQLLIEGQKLIDEKAAMAKHFETIHALVTNLAVTPQALQLQKKASVLIENFDHEMEMTRAVPPQAVTKEMVMNATAKMEWLVEELKHLPVMPAEQIQKELNDYPEENIYYNRN